MSAFSTAGKRSYYDVLGVDANADNDQIKAAYREQAKQNHPDTAEDKTGATQRMQEINEAYAFLKDEGRRQAYNESIQDQQWEEERLREAETRRKEEAARREAQAEAAAEARQQQSQQPEGQTTQSAANEPTGSWDPEKVARPNYGQYRQQRPLHIPVRDHLSDLRFAQGHDQIFNAYYKMMFARKQGQREKGNPFLQMLKEQGFNVHDNVAHREFVRSLHKLVQLVVEGKLNIEGQLQGDQATEGEMAQVAELLHRINNFADLSIAQQLIELMREGGNLNQEQDEGSEGAFEMSFGQMKGEGQARAQKIWQAFFEQNREGDRTTDQQRQPDEEGRPPQQRV